MTRREQVFSLSQIGVFAIVRTEGRVACDSPACDDDKDLETFWFSKAYSQPQLPAGPHDKKPGAGPASAQKSATSGA